MIGHVEPEAACGGPLALVHEGDRIRIDVHTRVIDLLVAHDVLGKRRAAWVPPEPKYAAGTILRKYADKVSGPSTGAVLV